MSKNPSVIAIKEELKKHVQDSPMRNSVEMNPEFTGVARSVMCFKNQGHNNFRILTLHITKGKVTRCDYSDAYANFEAIARLEIWNEFAMINLNMNWKDGETFKK